MNLQVTLFTKCLCLLSLVLVGHYSCRHRSFGFHPVLVMDMLRWVFSTAFTCSFTAGKCCQFCCRASSSHPVRGVDGLQVDCPGLFVGYRAYFCGFWREYIKIYCPFSNFDRERLPPVVSLRYCLVHACCLSPYQQTLNTAFPLSG